MLTHSHWCHATYYVLYGSLYVAYYVKMNMGVSKHVISTISWYSNQYYKEDHNESCKL